MCKARPLSIKEKPLIFIFVYKLNSDIKLQFCMSCQTLFHTSLNRGYKTWGVLLVKYTIFLVYIPTLFITVYPCFLKRPKDEACLSIETGKAKREVGNVGMVPASGCWGTKKFLDICKIHDM